MIVLIYVVVSYFCSLQTLAALQGN